MMKAFPVMEISWNFEILQNIMEKWEETWKNENFSSLLTTSVLPSKSDFFSDDMSIENNMY